MDDLRYTLFDKYLNNELTDVELQSFNNTLQTDEDFKQEFEIYKALDTSFASKFENEHAEVELKKTLQQLGNQYIADSNISAPKPRVIHFLNYKKLMVAASIAILIGFFVFNNGQPTYADFNNHATLELVVRGDQNQTFLKAEQAFNAKNYQAALKELTVLSALNPNDVEIYFYRGICNLELDNIAEATSIFEHISKGTSSYSNNATWYLALTYLKQENYTKCKQTLQLIPETAEVYAQAQKLLKKL